MYRPPLVALALLLAVPALAQHRLPTGSGAASLGPNGGLAVAGGRSVSGNTAEATVGVRSAPAANATAVNAPKNLIYLTVMIFLPYD